MDKTRFFLEFLSKMALYSNLQFLYCGETKNYDDVIERTFDGFGIQYNHESQIEFAIDDDVYNFHYVFVVKEEKKIKGLGTFNTLKFHVRLVAGSVFTGKDEMTIWVTDDENKVTLLFESPIIVGKVQGRLTEYSNLKGPLTSKIK